MSNLDELLSKINLMEKTIDDSLTLGESFNPYFPNLKRYIKAAKPDFKFYPFLKPIIHRLEAIALGRSKAARIIITCPPRHGKSTIISRLFTGYFMAKNPGRTVGLASYSSDLSISLSRDSRDFLTRSGCSIRRDVSSTKLFETNTGSQMWSSGVFGSITGKGFDLGIIDDPIKSHEEAASARHQEKIFAWYRSVFYTRREPGASIVIIMTRWSDNDLVGRLLEEEKDKTSVEGWHIIHLPAIKDFNKPKFPITCTVEKDDRNSGEALCSHRYDKDELLKIRNSIGEYFFSSLYQGKPIPKSGFKFKTKWFNILPEDTPRVIQAPRIRYWDMAATQDGGTATAGVLMAKIAGKIIIEDVISGHWSVENRNKMILETAEKDYSFYQGKVSIHFEQEPGSSGKEAAQSMRRLLGKFRAFADRPTGSKEVRAEPMISYASTHGISLMSGDWNDSYIDEMTSFPLGQLKDVVDASSGGFNKLFKRSAKAR